MAPSTNKRKKHPPGRTLTDFFSGADTIKRPRAKPSRQLTPSARQAVTREIIVIDSESDDDHGKEAGTEGAQLDRKTQVSDDLPALLRSKDKDMFGVPSELLRSTTPLEASGNMFHTVADAPRHDQSEAMFGLSAPLLEEPRTSLWAFREVGDDPNLAYTGSQLSRESQSMFPPENVSTVAGSNLGDGSVVGFPIGEWAAADDELVALEASDHTEIADGEAHQARECDESKPFDEERVCPVCEMDLGGIDFPEVQTHVNQCLDKASRNVNFVQECAPARLSIKSNVTAGNSGQQDDLYTVLMASRKENEIWVEADATTHCDLRLTRGDRKRAPFYKVLRGMPIAVDAFCYGAIPGITAYFLTHAHSDHYTNLGSKWNSGPIYCSEETANLIIHMLAVHPSWIHPLPMDTPTVISNTGGVSVTLIEANHCPGSCLFLFEGVQTINAGDSTFKSPFVGSPRIFRYLHCGDFRASPRHVLHPAVNGKHLDHIYLDTTYLDSKYTFSPQPLVISACADLARRLVGRDNPDIQHTKLNITLDNWMKSPISVEKGEKQILQERILVIVGTYSIGKERIVKAIAQALGTKIYCDQRKTAILRCQADDELHSLLVADPVEADVHILPLGTVTSDNLRSYLQRFKGVFSRAIAFRPTGWSYSPPSGSDFANASIQSIISHGQSRDFSCADLKPSQKSLYDIQIFGVPYSEHSSFFELTCFAMSCQWGKIIPTVNVGNPTSRAKMAMWLRRWESEKRCAGESVVQPRTADYW